MILIYTQLWPEAYSIISRPWAEWVSFNPSNIESRYNFLSNKDQNAKQCTIGFLGVTVLGAKKRGLSEGTNVTDFNRNQKLVTNLYFFSCLRAGHVWAP